MIGISLPFVYATAKGIDRRQRSICLLGLALSFTATAGLWRAYDDHQFRRAQAFLAAVGGHPYPGPRARHHPLWHALHCGLSDFAADRGYSWRDGDAFRYAFSVMKERYNIDVPWSGGPVLDLSYDARGYYRVKPDQMELYTAIVRGRVLQDILTDPVWYLNILAKRWKRVMEECVPLQLRIGDRSVGLRLSGWAFFAALTLTAIARDWFLLKLLLFTLPLTFVSLFVHSGAGTVNYSLLPTMTAAVTASLAARHAGWAVGVLKRKQKIQKRV